jgi:class 3 adenylate cyclase/tetratricopeptide (TPR) repeat protein
MNDVTDGATVICPNCGTELPGGANFCFNCGYRLASPPAIFPAGDTPSSRPVYPPASLQPYVPSELLEKLSAARARGSMVGERRVLTMLFCDVKGSTAAAEQLDPEEWSEIMNGAFEYLIAPVYRYEGTVARLMGDGILAFFGAPIAHEDDPERAVLAGLEIVRGIREYGRQIKGRWGLEFGVRVGINTGLVVVGEVGSDLRMEYTAMGDAINVAARMESTALPGTVQITANTYRRVAPLFDVWEVGGIEVKGKAEPVLAYRVLGTRPDRGRTRGIEGLAAPLVGREVELNALRHALTVLRKGQGRIVCLIGGAGLGKSRLIQELHAEWIATLPSAGASGDWSRWMEMGAMSYEAGRAYGVLKHQIRQFGGIYDGDSPQWVREKLARTLSIFPEPERSRMLGTYVSLFGLGDREGSASPLEGEAFKQELFQVTLEAMRAQVTERPTVYVIDDLHWVDAASVELLVHMLQLVTSCPILFLFSARPYQGSPGWRIKKVAETDYAGEYMEIPLRPLTLQQGNALVEGLLKIENLAAPLRALILKKAEGNPFFMEEIVRSLIDQDILRRERIDGTACWQVAADIKIEELAIPDSVQALVMARIDRLPEDIRHTLQLAAVVGRSFNHRVLAAVSPAGEELGRQLETLQRTDLITAQGPEAQFSFRHALMRDAAYHSILLRHRRQFHRRVGEAMERLYGDRLEEHAGALAYHFAQAHDDERALRYYIQAGDAAAQLFASTEAVDHYTRAQEAAGRTNAPGDVLHHLYQRRGRMLEMEGHYDEALDNYRYLEALACKRGDRKLELAALIPQATVYSTFTVKFDPQQGRALSQQALALAQALDDPRAQARIYWNLMLSEIYTDGDPQQAVAYGERSLAIAREHDLPEELAYTLHDLTRAYAAVGQRERAIAVMEEAGALWRQMGNLPMLADYLATGASVYSNSGQYERAIETAEEGLILSRRIGSLWGQAYSLITVAPIYLDRGEAGKAIKAWEEGLQLAERANFAGPLVFSRADLAQAYGLLGDWDRALELARHALDRAEQLEAHHLRPYAEVVLAWVHLQRRDVDTANALFERIPLDSATLNSELVWRVTAVTIEEELALVNQDCERALRRAEETIELMRAAELYPFLADILLLKGRALRCLGRPAQAREALVEARAEAEALQARRVLWRVLAELGQVAADEGDTGTAAALRQQARDVVAYIGDRAGTPELRALFLARPDVQALMSADAPSL